MIDKKFVVTIHTVVDTEDEVNQLKDLFSARGTVHIESIPISWEEVYTGYE